jgi:signal transduction histidine kinase
MGIPERDIPRIFDKFYRSDSSDSQIAYGYGLGLYICRQLVKAMGGKIWAENHPNGGAVFSFSLPIWQESSDDSAA